MKKLFFRKNSNFCRNHWICIKYIYLSRMRSLNVVKVPVDMQVKCFVNYFVKARLRISQKKNNKEDYNTSIYNSIRVGYCNLCGELE